MADVAVIMGSKSDLETMRQGIQILDTLGISFEVEIVSAHRTPEKMFAYAKAAEQKNIKVIIAGAGGAAHLPGMVAALTNLPVIGVPVQSKALNGLDSLLSIVQMPAGVPVATVAIGEAGAKNAAILVAKILALSNPTVKQKVEQYIKEQTTQTLNSSQNLNWK